MKMNFNLLKGENDNLNDSLLDNHLAKNFNFGLNGISIKDQKGFIKHLEKELTNIQFSNFDYGFGKTTKYLEKKDKEKPINDKVEDCFFIINEFSLDSYVEIYAKTLKELEYLFALSKDFMEEDEEPKVRVHNYYFEGKLNYKETTIKAKDLGDIIPEYYKDFSDVNEFFKQFTLSKDNILVLSGKTGTGKTKFANLYLNYLMDNIDILEKDDEYEEDNNYVNIAYVKNEDILSLDSFWINLREYDYDVVILDDLDYFLTPRSETISSEKMILKDKFISQFLSFTDGLVPNKTKFFITTNRTVDAIDEALKREGRLFGVFEFALLTKDEAKEIWLKAELKEEDFNIEFEEENILQAKLAGKISSYKKNNGKAKKFLKDNSNADITNKFTKKKVGF